MPPSELTLLRKLCAEVNEVGKNSKDVEAAADAKALFRSFLVGKTPLLRAFVYAKKDAHKASFREFSLIWGISILPILGAIAVDVVTGYSVFIGHVGNDTSWLGGFGVRLYDNVKAGDRRGPG